MTTRSLFEAWRPITFSSELVAQHQRQAAGTQLHECARCGLGIFLPQIIGTPQFYVEGYNLSGAQKDSEFGYSETKWDFDVAIEDAAGCTSLIDVGCGTGNFLQRAASNVGTVYGIEYNEPAAARARERGLRVFDSLEAVPAAGTLDAAFSFHVLEHVADPVDFMTKLARLVRPGGLVCVSVPDQDGPLRFLDPCAMNMPPHHATRWRLRALRALGERTGLQLERVAREPLLLENHSYWSVSWVAHVLHGRSPPVAALRTIVSLGLRAFFRALRAAGLQYFRPLRGQSIYVRFRQPMAPAAEPQRP